MKGSQKKSKKARAISKVPPCWLSSAEHECLLSTCAVNSKDKGNNWLYDVVDFALNADMSKEQILSLTWNQVDFCSGLISVSKGVSTAKMYLNTQTLKVLRKRKRKALGEFVFAKEVGKRIRTEIFDKAFRNALREAGMEWLRFDDLRKNFIFSQFAFAVFSAMEDEALTGGKGLALLGDPEFFASWESERKKAQRKL